MLFQMAIDLMLFVRLCVQRVPVHIHDRFLFFWRLPSSTNPGAATSTPANTRSTLAPLWRAGCRPWAPTFTLEPECTMDSIRRGNLSQTPPPRPIGSMHLGGLDGRIPGAGRAAVCRMPSD
jgi:hypothetical protein